MKNSNLKIASIILATTAYLASAIAYADSADAPAKVKVVKPLSVISTQGIVFEGVVVSSSTYNVSVSPSGNVINEGPALLIGANEAKFTASGAPHYPVTVSLPESVTLTGAETGDNLQLSNFAHNAGSNPTFNAEGQLAFGVGASLQVKSQVASDVYTGTLTVSVDY